MGKLAVIIIFFLSSLFVGGQNSFFSTSNLQKIEIHFSQQNWDYMLDTAAKGSGEYISAQWIKVNGSYFENVGIKYKGNSSYDSTYTKNPIHIELNTFKSQDYFGIVDIKLSNAYADPSMVREVLAYQILGNYMDAPRANFAQVYVNGSYRGLYTNSESINKGFCADHFYSRNGTFVKCNPELTPAPNVKSNLKYLSGDSSNYFNYYELKSDYGWKHLEALCDTVSINSDKLAKVMDVDRVLWMLAFNNLLVNLDSYNGAFAQNYYLYRDSRGLFNPIVWDLNMSFGGFPFLGSANTSLASLSIANMQVLPISIHANDNYWPLIKTIQNNSLYKKMYAAHLKTMTTEFFSNGTYLNLYNTYQSTIDTAVLADPGKFYSYTQFQNALNANTSVGTYSVPGVKTLMDARINYLANTSEFTDLAPTITQINNGNPSATTLSTAITASVSNAQSASVYLGYRSIASSSFTRVLMYDDGLHSDGLAGDQVYGAIIPLNSNSTQFYIYAENSSVGVFSPERAEHEFYNIDLYNQPEVGQLTINEFLANNKSDVKNEFHLNEDWIELYNNSSSVLNLDGLYLSDSYNSRAAYRFPAKTIIQPNSFLTVWADQITFGNQLHASFKLNEEGEEVVLSNGLSKILDRTSYGQQEEDVSLARCPDGTGPFVLNAVPSFGMSNCITGIEENSLDNTSLLIYPNPAKDFFTVNNSNNRTQNLYVYDQLGKLIFESTITETLTVNTINWPAGLYVVKCDQKHNKLIIRN